MENLCCTVQRTGKREVQTIEQLYCYKTHTEEEKILVNRDDYLFHVTSYYDLLSRGQTLFRAGRYRLQYKR